MAEIQAIVILVVTMKVNFKGTTHLVSCPLHITTVSYHDMVRDKILSSTTCCKILNLQHVKQEIEFSASFWKDLEFATPCC